MDKGSKRSPLPSFLRGKRGRDILIILIMASFWGGCLIFRLSQPVEADFEGIFSENPVLTDSIVIQGNSLLPLSSPLSFEEENKEKKEIEVVVTGYSSSSWQTDDTPHLTAAGTQTRDGIVATNILPFGTKIRLPELYGDKIFTVEDRMSSEKGYNVDIWFHSYQEAVNFGIKSAKIEIIG